MNVGVVSLGEAGNYGDDLILLAVLDAVARADPAAHVAFLSFGDRIPLDDLRSLVALPAEVERRSHRYREILPSRGALHEDRDLVLMGGGGLLQTSHHPSRPYHWLGFLPDAAHSIPVIGVGLGLGPVDPRWTRALSRIGSPFSALAVRDAESATLARGWGWPTTICQDFIHGRFLEGFLSAVARPRDPSPARPRLLGVSLRQWPGADPESVAEHIRAVCRREDCHEVAFFVLESKGGEGVDVDHTRVVQRALRDVPSRIHVYTSGNIVGFTRALTGVDVAISMKLHASAVWDASGIPLYPIVYAPKMASFFGLPYRGLEFLPSRVATPPASPAPSAQDVVAAALDRWRSGELPVPAWSPSASWRGREQARSLAHDIRTKVRSHVRGQG